VFALQDLSGGKEGRRQELGDRSQKLGIRRIGEGRKEEIVSYE